MERTLGTSQIRVSALGMGCWAIGGIWQDAGMEAQSWNGITREESIAAVHAALDHGITFFDTADTYGAGKSEKVLGEALRGKRDRVVIATKFGHIFDETTGTTGLLHMPESVDERYIRSALEASLRRLGTDYIDLYQFHLWDYPQKKSGDILETLEKLADEGKIRAYAWSTDRLDAIRSFARGSHCYSTQIMFNIFEGNRNLLKFCEEKGLSALARSPLAMGLLSGKYDPSSKIGGSDPRNARTEWIVWFRDGKANPEYLKRLDAVRDILVSNGRTVVQGAIAWLWGKSGALIPIPGIKNRQQAEENARAMEFGPLSAEQVADVERLVGFTDMKIA